MTNEDGADLRHGPLRGIRVLEFSQLIAGPIAGVHLSDLHEAGVVA